MLCPFACTGFEARDGIHAPLLLNVYKVFSLGTEVFDHWISSTDMFGMIAGSDIDSRSVFDSVDISRRLDSHNEESETGVVRICQKLRDFRIHWGEYVLGARGQDCIARFVTQIRAVRLVVGFP
ncbi:MAG: hypothetical protein AABZ47_10270 [Planctomycetota bacterium]